MAFSERRIALNRVRALFEERPLETSVPRKSRAEAKPSARRNVASFLLYPIRERSISANEALFTADYPSILLATASNVKAGMAPLTALERSARILPEKNIVKLELNELLTSLREGKAKEEAIENFAASIRHPEIQLFRRAFLLILENGGRFAPTLERLAKVSRDRASLIHSAQVSTANMRMTANILLTLCPLILLLVASRSPNYVETLLTNTIANTIASIGASTIALSYGVLRRMSDFKP